MTMRYIVFFLGVLFIGCMRIPDAETFIRRALEEQQAAWNEGDIPGFMSYYLNDESLTFTGSSGLKRGYKTVLDSYLSRYDTPEKMGQLNFEILEIKILSDKTALVIGSWSLNRKTDRPSGYFSLVWANTNDGWKIIHDHTS